MNEIWDVKSIVLQNIFWVIVVIVALVLVCILYWILKNRKTLELFPHCIMGTIGFVLIIIGMHLTIGKDFGLSFLTIGIGSFLLLLALMSVLTYLSISSNDSKIQNERRKKSLLILDKKEIRRSIAISFTILFILLISFYFEKNTTPAAEVITAFASVYLVIIGFYFGSRVYEKIKEIKNAEEVLKIEYILDEIEEDVFNKKMKKLRGRINSQLRINATEEPSEITIEHRGGDDIDLKDTMIVIKKNEKETKIDPVARATNMFKVTHKMVIHMGKAQKESGIEVTDITVTNKSYLFEIDAKLDGVLNDLSKNKNSDNMEKLKKGFKAKEVYLPNEPKVEEEKENNWEITKSTFTVKKEEGKLKVYTNSVFNKEYISNGITEWKKDKKVEVDVVYKPTNEIISPWEGEIKKGKGVDS